MGEVPKKRRLDQLVKTIERYIIKTLIALMSLLLILATLQLGYLVIVSILRSEVFLLDMDVLMDLFGVFLLVLIGIELLDTIKVYFKKHDIHVEVVILVAIIAIARKIILMDMDTYSGLEILGIAAVVIALTLGYYLIKKSGGAGFWPAEQEVSRDIVIEEKEFDPESKTKIAERKKVVKQHTTETKAPPEASSVYTGPKDTDIETDVNQKPDEDDDIND
jgi:uncharacterized membrane protein (DUF373 family)